MKTIVPAKRLALATAFAADLFLAGSSLFAGDTQATLEKRFPHVIQFEVGLSSGFYGGDQFTITSVRGDRAHIEPGGSYLVEGTYTLASRDSAQLILSCTTHDSSGPTPVQDGERTTLAKGTGRFYLYETNLADGWLHVSFATIHGNSYFGEKGRESTIKREYLWDKVTPVQRPTSSIGR
jgi:hypothetical protein